MSDTCKNCNAVLGSDDKYCRNCGQKNMDRVTIGFLFSKLLSNYLSFDSKLFRTIPNLLFNPGYIPRKFIDGVRTRFLEPVQLLFFAIMVLFLTMNFLVDYDVIEKQFFTEVTEGLNKQDTVEIHALTIASEDRIVPQVDSLMALNKTNEEIYAHFDKEGSPKFYHHFLLNLYRNRSSGIIKIFLNQLWIAVLLLMPFIALFLLLINMRKGLNYAENFIHVSYLISFIVVLSTVFLWLSQYFQFEILLGIYFLILILYSYISFIRFYKDHWFKAFLKLFLSFIVSTIIIFPALAFVSILLTVIGY